MSLHRFLTNIDVLHAVFDHLDLLPRPITDFARGFYARHESIVARRTLANAALTCRAFSEPASKTLWKCLHQGLLPLLNTLSCFKETGVSSGGIPSYISAAEWERFDRLASWVRYIGYHHSGTVVLESSVVDTLVQRRQTKGSLLPNLHILSWPVPMDLQRTLLRALCAAPSLSLVHLDEGHRFYDPYETRDIAVIAETCPGLARFLCNLRLRLPSPLLSLRSLRSLQVGEADKASFCQIGTLPYLTDLCTSIRGIRDSESPPVNEGAFVALRRFQTSGALAALIWMITQISSPDLTSLSVETDAKDIADMLPFFETVLTLPAAQSLQRLHLVIEMHSDDEAVGRKEVAFADLAQHILPLRRLEDVRVHVRYRTLSLSDADIVLIKSAWLRLRRLSLSFRAASSELEPVQLLRPSLSTLVDLALARPQFETLDVEVVSVTEDDLIRLESISLAAAPEVVHPTTALKWLTFARRAYRSRITFPADIPRLARALHGLFPLLGGLGRPMRAFAERGVIRYQFWTPRCTEYDLFRVLEKLEKLKSQRASRPSYFRVLTPAY
ncbi:hypothetical protein C8Q74DRAFT_1371955 [Fomes fomentarius]|nr:hypothetical protein C8Q74DRAFT_1371955 [Fomes fomentarius]